MGRIYLSIGIIVSIIILDITSIFLIKNEQENITLTLDSIQEYMDNDEKESAVLEAVKLSRQWNSSYKRIVFFVNSKSLEDINDFVSRIEPLIRSDSDEINAEIETIKRKIYRIYIKDVPYIYNIF